MRRVARLGDRALALVKCGKKLRWVSGRISRGSANTFAEGRPVARHVDKVRLGCAKTGRIAYNVARKTLVNFRRVALIFSGIIGPGIVRGYVIQAARSVYAG